MAKYYKFPRSYRNRNKVRKPIKPKEIVLVVLLCCFFYFIVSIFFVSTVRMENSSMTSEYNKGDVLLVSHIGFCGIRTGNLSRGDVVLVKPSYYKNMPAVIAACDYLLRFLTFQKVGISDFVGYEHGYVVKRIIGVPGDTVMMKDNIAYIKIPESPVFVSEFEFEITPAARSQNTDSFQGNMEPEKIEKGTYFVLSDNRDYLSDSRSMENVKYSQIKAKVLYCFGMKQK